MFHKVFIANRGEVAVRVAKACRELGITPVFGVSEADQNAPYTRGANVVVLGPARAAQSYLDVERVVQAAAQSGCTALHPGWGFLSENPLLATLCQQHGITFIGPPPHVTSLMGSKIRAKRAMTQAGLDVIAGSDGAVTEASAQAIAERVGYPVLLKAVAGGGGRGMRIVTAPGELAARFAEASAEARAAFGGDALYLEKLVTGGRHVEIQVFADRYGNAVHLGERDCTVQRNHQKLIEESPCPVLTPAQVEVVATRAASASAAVGYAGAGTMEMLLDAGTLRFMEMNCRLQVEHSVTEMRTGLDLVKAQLAVAAGERLPWMQADIQPEGHVLECRINAEDPSDGFRPSPGRITTWGLPEASRDVRIDTHVEEGYEVPPHYDSLLCKVLVRAETRAAACQRMIGVLGAMRVEGVKTTIAMHRAILASDAFLQNAYDTRTLPGWSA